ncbi:hypothetical protein DFJ77DRAFT_452759 [Powellomyces hirtus]|nr:hypothetical protein DFJ77DRAFT_452759 [Powellomyces hirtus]
MAGSTPGPDDGAANQDDFIAFDDLDDSQIADALDGPGPASEAQGAALAHTPAPRNRPFKLDSAPGRNNASPLHNRDRASRTDPRTRPSNHMEPKDMDVLTPLPIPPWQPPNRVYSRNLLKMLHEEINDYIAYLIPTEAEHAMRKLTVDRVTKVVQSVRPHAKVSVFGSFETKLYLPSSDVDMVVLDSSMGNRAPLNEMEKAIRKAGIASKIECIAGAKVPIIKMVDSLTRYPADISFNVPAGVKAAEIVKKFIDDPKYGEGLRPLLLIMKQFLYQRNLNEVFTGGIGSYTLMSLIVAFLKMHPKLQSGQIAAKDNLGILLIEFLDFYGNQFNYEDVGIGLNLKDVWYYPKSSLYPPNRCWLPRPPTPQALCVLDPQDMHNEIAGGSKAWRAIRAEFSRAAQLLVAMIGAGYHRAPHHPSNATVTTLLGSILCVRRETIEHRESVHECYESIQHNLDAHIESNNGEQPATRAVLKRKRGGTDSPHPARKEKEHIYVAEISDDSDEFVELPSSDSEDLKIMSVKGRYHTPGKRAKLKRNPLK